MKQRKQLTIIFGIIAGVSVCLIAVVLWMVNKEHRFLNYKNTTYSFSIKYPTSWALSENQNGTAVMFTSPLENKLDTFKENFNVVVQDLSQHPTKLDIYTMLSIAQMKVLFKSKLVVVDSSPAYLDGHPAYNFTFIVKEADSEMKFKSIWTVVKDVKAYQVTYGATSSQYDKYLPQIDKMIKSFKIQ